MELSALISLAFVASITPGPNNVMLLASGMNHGVRRTLPHLAGVSLGFALLIFMIALGLGSVFERYEGVELVLRWVGGTYLAYLAWRIFNTRAAHEAGRTAAPMTFVQAAVFQWVNPKAWIIAATATSTVLVTPGSVAGGAAALAFGIWIVNLPCISTWMFSGAYAARWINDERRVRTINRALGLLLGATVVVLIS